MQKFIKDVIHGEIFINPSDAFITELLDTKEMKRLRNIYQLGECHNVFFSATNNRYSHSIGVYHNAKRFLEHMNVKLNKSDYQSIIAAALLHDIGHGPRSHCFELYAKLNHEKMSIKIISDPNTEVNQVLTKYKINVDTIVQIIKKVHPIMFYNQIISSQIDADRLDYLCRDSYFIGAKYGNIEPGIIIQWSKVIDNHIVFDAKAIDLIEDVLFARWQMFKQIYCNRKVLVYEYLIKHAFQQFKLLSLAKYKFKNTYNLYYLLDSFVYDKEWDIDNFLKLDESTMRLIILSWNLEDDVELKSFTNSYLYDNQYECSDAYFISNYPNLEAEEVKYKICIYNDKEPVLIEHSGVVKNISEFNTFLLSNTPNKIWESSYYFYKKTKL